jgi:hypothetical protein
MGEFDITLIASTVLPLASSVLFATNRNEHATAIAKKETA